MRCAPAAWTPAAPRGIGPSFGARDTVSMSAEAVPHRGTPRQALLERDAEFGLLTDLVHDVAAGGGRLLLLEAPAGLGKSTLLEHGASMGRAAGLLVLRSRGHQLERTFAWGVARSLFEALLLGLPQQQRAMLLDGPAAPARQVFDDSGEQYGQQSPDAGFAILH